MKTLADWQNPLITLDNPEDIPARSLLDLTGRLVWGWGEEFEEGDPTGQEIWDQPESGCIDFYAGPEDDPEAGMGWLSDTYSCYDSMKEHLKGLPGLEVGIAENLHQVCRSEAMTEAGRDFTYEEMRAMIREKLNALGIVELDAEGNEVPKSELDEVGATNE